MPTRTHLRGSLDFFSGYPTFWPLASQVSGDLLSLRGCQALAILPPADAALPQGHLVCSFLLSLAFLDQDKRMNHPLARISSHGIQRWKHRHPWIYRSDIRSLEPAEPTDDLIAIAPEKGPILGWAWYSPHSQIALRRVSWGKSNPGDFWKGALLQAAKTRASLPTLAPDLYRLVHGEVDGLPATVIDRYGSVFVLQTLCPASDALKAEITDFLVEHFNATAVVERNESKVRELEKLPLQKGLLFGSLPDPLFVRVAGLRFLVDPFSGQKTGAFLDQSETFLKSRPYAQKATTILEVCSYQGWFSCLAAAAASSKASVLALDSAGNALDILRQNAENNGLSKKIDTLEGNAFDLLREMKKESYDLIFLDPPAFIKSKQTFEAGLRGYKELNLRCLHLLAPGGVLISSSCSYHLSRKDLWDVLQSAAADQGVDLQLLEIWGQGPDHPRLANFPESDYLKTFVVRRLS